MPSRRSKHSLKPQSIILLNRLRKRIKNIRQLHNVSQWRFGELIGYNVNETYHKELNRVIRSSNYTKIETSRSFMPIDKLWNFCKVFNISIDELLQDAEPKIIVGNIYESNLSIVEGETVMVYIALANGWLFLAAIAGWTLLMSASVNGRAYLMVFVASITYFFHRKPVTFTQYLIGFLKKKTK